MILLQVYLTVFQILIQIVRIQLRLWNQEGKKNPKNLPSRREVRFGELKASPGACIIHSGVEN